MKIKNLLIVPFLALGMVACGNSQKTDDTQATEKKVVIKAPAFNADSAYTYIQTQADFGPRVPNSQAHRDCGEYLAKQLEKFGAKVYNQYADLTAWDGTVLKARNIIGSYKPESKKRILLCAHWDSRPYADNDPDTKNHHKHILGVNDGAIRLHRWHHRAHPRRERWCQRCRRIARNSPSASATSTNRRN